MSEEMRKRNTFTRRHRSALSGSDSTPLPEGGVPPSEGGMGAACGHSSCGHSCNVRYVGAVSQIRDHHAMHAARGVGHIWAASIVTGFAIVLTGVIAFNSVDAQTRAAVRAPAAPSQAELVRSMNDRLERLEKIMLETREICRGGDLGMDGQDALFGATEEDGNQPRNDQQVQMPEASSTPPTLKDKATLPPSGQATR